MKAKIVFALISDASMFTRSLVYAITKIPRKPPQHFTERFGVVEFHSNAILLKRALLLVQASFPSSGFN